MLRRISDLLFPMQTGITNRTMEEYNKIRNLSLSLFLMLIQAVYTMQDRLDLSFLNFLFSSDAIEEYVVGFLLNTSAYVLIYNIVLVGWQRYWIAAHADTCYLAGTWYHVYDRSVDNDKSYVRGGWLTIQQNFYDIEVSAYNYDIYEEADGSLRYDPSGYSHWSFSLAEIQDNGTVNACFVKEKETADVLSKTGLMLLNVYSKDATGKVNELVGFTSDSGASTIRGGIRLFKLKEDGKTDFSFMKTVPTAWTDYIRMQFKAKRKI